MLFRFAEVSSAEVQLLSYAKPRKFLTKCPALQLRFLILLHGSKFTFTAIAALGNFNSIFDSHPKTFIAIW